MFYLVQLSYRTSTIDDIRLYVNNDLQVFSRFFSPNQVPRTKLIYRITSNSSVSKVLGTCATEDNFLL